VENVEDEGTILADVRTPLNIIPAIVSPVTLLLNFVLSNKQF